MSQSPEVVAERARPDVPGPMPFLPDGGNWEGGTVDTNGQRWTHIPHVGWRRERGPRHPFLVNVAP